MSQIQQVGRPFKCFPCRNTGKQKDKDGAEVICPKCGGTGVEKKGG